MDFKIGNRVVLVDSDGNGAAGLIGRRGDVRGISCMEESPAVHLAYAVSLDGGDVYMVEPDALISE